MVDAIFKGEDPGGVLWQPRLEFWYAVNKKRDTLPAHLQDCTLFELYDYCLASIRYQNRSSLQVRYSHVTASETWESEKQKRITWHTPVGVLTDMTHYDEWNLSAHRTEYRLKNPEDFAVLEYIYKDEQWYWDQQLHEKTHREFALYGPLQFYFRRSPIQNLFISDMGFERTIYTMYDRPDVIQRYLDFAEKADNPMYDVICECPVKILNFGENIDAFMDSPDIWMQYFIPYYRKRLRQLHEAGKFVHIHIDGAMKPLLPYLRECPWDGIEAATPVPQGDVTVEQIKEALGDIVLLDGIPALFFLPSFPVEDLFDCARKIVKFFYPRLILGISDEIPPDGDIERVRAVGKLVRNMV